ncbi:tRNA (N6-threonylcarbamoyladenosine(37)-N6)-methyltransferase TrmO [Sagittula sp. P11]|uniref:tRNA (N6-threonylcarbamoyladenosine(37)-N6)-methyltransferase TrmO n=1 Tax=Sagittula sp. P11 TaxID=2009329 RepID=UPI000C2D0A44|nr:tRNA (N6-threonylcarbamoyladenosine(37)-N6)-methyltransferase TrmO [Sagittula sp. P11]AUC54297.1 tRNA (N6-threonylcarbamoyladenosine(37)-N6)-methyltransferase TrmO [Sagittula sp. P11]
MADHHGDAQRPGELRVDLPPAEDAGLRFIGVLRTPFTDRSLCPHQGDMEAGPECFVDLHAPYVPALDGIEAQDHLQLLYWLHEARRDLLTQQRRGEGAPRGTFTLRSPLRPNPLGVSSVRLLRREGARLVVRGLDCLDGTPLLDIKPIRCGKEPR